MTLQKAGLPSCVEVEGKLYELHTDFRFSLILLERIRENAPLLECDFMYVGEPPPNREAGFRAIAEWLSPKIGAPRPATVTSSDILLDYEQDAALIYAAFYEQYGIDLFDERLRLHWHKFLALLYGLHDTRLNEVQGYRAYKPRKGEPAEYRREMLRLKAMWRLEERLSPEEQAQLDAFQAQLKD